MSQVAKVKRVDKEKAVVELNDGKREVYHGEDLKIGDQVLINANMVLQKLSDKDVLKIKNLYKKHGQKV